MKTIYLLLKNASVLSAFENKHEVEFLKCQGELTHPKDTYSIEKVLLKQSATAEVKDEG